uniref:UDP-N-acetylmuramoylalanine--D-glutamate ligase n=1 Tax=Desulfatirhabdium butyrativorans TaxID=340467 RepID=A0A7C4RSP7_9BACT
MVPMDIDVENRRFAVVGLGLSGAAVCRFLLRRNARVFATDLSMDPAVKKTAEELRGLGADVLLGHHSDEVFRSADAIVISPGVPHTLGPFEEARRRGVPVLGEIELAARFVSRPILAITGTNGKTTVTTLIGDILRRSGQRVFVGGNIGNPLIEWVDRNEPVDWIVLEVSSFQLDTSETFRPDIGVLLNITEDHLDRYASMEAYAASKFRLFRRQRAEDWAVLNAGDAFVRQFADTVGSRRLWYNVSQAEAEEGARVTDSGILWRIPDEMLEAVEKRSGFRLRDPIDPWFRVDRKDIGLPGRHNVENVAASILACMAAGASEEAVRDAIRTFTGLSHRMTQVDVIDGVTFVDDSKATNVDAVVRALEGYDRNVVILLGGRDKMSPFERLRDAVSEHVRHAVVIGEAAGAIEEAIRDLVPVHRASSMEEAVTIGFRLARPGDVVLLSPACASFDMFTSYAHRGQVFCEAVRRLGHDR